MVVSEGRLRSCNGHRRTGAALRPRSSAAGLAAVSRARRRRRADAVLTDVHDPEPPPWPGGSAEPVVMKIIPRPRLAAGVAFTRPWAAHSNPSPGIFSIPATIATRGSTRKCGAAGGYSQTCVVSAPNVPSSSASHYRGRLGPMRAFEDARRHLRARYRVTVRGLEDVPAWVTANRRGQGPPPEEVKLDLDLGKLDLGREFDWRFPDIRRRCPGPPGFTPPPYGCDPEAPRVRWNLSWAIGTGTGFPRGRGDVAPEACSRRNDGVRPG